MNFLFNKKKNNDEKNKLNLYPNSKYHNFNSTAKPRIYPRPLRIPNYYLPKNLKPEVIPFQLNNPKKIFLKPEIIKPEIKKNNNEGDINVIIISLIMIAVFYSVCKSN